MKFDVAALTDVGLKREINQDSVLVDHDLGLFVVADGMGGHRGGEVASALAVETVQDFIRERGPDALKTPKKLLVEAYREASARIHHKSTYESPELMGMGTTMVLMLAVNERAYIANVGDSRCYLFRAPYLWQITEDHSLINEQIKAGVILEEEAGHVLGRNVITRSVGFEREVMADIIERPIQDGDMFLLCSDGLSGLVSNDRIADVCKKGALKEMAQKCVAEAKRAGGDDNVSVILVRPNV
ncbi:MAG: Stp1/IreP family PP2C-type Ser/Thr phosphatase [Bdellovibrionales bacterium]